MSKPSLTSLTEDHSQGLDEVLRSGDHYVVILLAEDLWQQLTAMLAPLRSAHLHRLVPVVVLSRYRAPAWMRDKFPLTFWVMGNPFHVRTLSDEVRRAGGERGGAEWLSLASSRNIERGAGAS